jgi:homoserine O-acetyltransferase
VIHWTGADGTTFLSKNCMEALFAPGRPLDATRYFLILPDNVGHGKSSKPSDGLKAAFPKYGYADMVDLQHRLVTEKLDIEHLHAILGISMGGMNAWQWAEEYPDAMDDVMPVVSMPISISGRNMLWRRVCRGHRFELPCPLNWCICQAQWRILARSGGTNEELLSRRR